MVLAGDAPIDLLNRSFKSINVLRCAFVGK